MVLQTCHVENVLQRQYLHNHKILSKIPTTLYCFFMLFLNTSLSSFVWEGKSFASEFKNAIFFWENTNDLWANISLFSHLRVHYIGHLITVSQCDHLLPLCDNMTTSGKSKHTMRGILVFHDSEKLATPSSSNIFVSLSSSRYFFSLFLLSRSC